MVATSWSSSTVTTSASSLRIRAKVIAPGAVVWAPSAIVRGVSILTISPRRKDCWTSLPACGSTPITAHDGDSALAASAQPGNQPTAADRHQQEVQFADLLEQLLRGGALPGDHVAVVEGRDQRHALLAGQSAADRLAVLLCSGRR